MPNAPSTLAEVLEPANSQQFLSEHLGKTYRYYPGRADKFAALLPWTELNAILRHHRLEAPRLRLVKDGKALAVESYLSYSGNRRNPSSKVPRLLPEDLTRHLRQGATLILDAVDEIHEPITRLAENLESTLQARIQVNLYAGWRTTRGFDLHWDGHDVLILQISGRKHWKVYPMTRAHPLPDDPKSDNPPDAPLWEGMLETGDVLYIPRGWWHVAIPLDEPTLHLTVGFHQTTGMDFMAWFADRLRENPIIRQDLPRLASASAQAAHLEQLQDACAKAWAKPGLLEQYFRYQDQKTRARPQFGLPFSATASILPPGDASWALRWLVRRPLECACDNAAAVVVRCNGKEWTFAAAARPVLEKLQSSTICTLDELSTAVHGSLPPEQLRIFLKELVDAGLASVVDRPG